MGAAAVVLGASGYAGGELLRYLSMHPGIEVTAASAAGKAGSEVAQVLPHLATSDLRLRPVEDVFSTHADVVFSCLPADVRPSFDPATCIIDLSDAHRADPAWTYGLPEFDRRGITEARRIANPGCYPTAALLALIPFVHQQAIDGPVVVDALSGTSGAGRKQEDRLLHASVDSSAAAYGTVDHRHVPEIERGLARFGGEGMTVSFTPHLVPMSRGLLVTARGRLRKPLDDRDAVRILVDAYGREPFVSVIEGWPSTKSVAGTNRALVAARVDKRAGMLVCSAAIDNLGKGAAGQALQNANLVLGLDETTGLEAVAAWP